MSIVELIKYIFLGLIQGFTEVLPISSTGHVALFQIILNIDTDSGLVFMAIVNFGSLLAVVWHFRLYIGRLIKNFFVFMFDKESRNETRDDFLYAIKIIIGVIPAAFAGLFLTGYVNEIYKRYSLLLVGIGLLVTSTFLFIVRKGPERHVKQTLTFKDATIIGLLQPFSIVPGLSRSGITVSGGLLRKASMDTSLSFSFMLYIPLSIGFACQSVYYMIVQPTGHNLGFDPSDLYQYIYYGAAFLASLAATRIGLKYIFKWFRNGKLVIFAYYTLFLGMIALVAGAVIL
ncbi:MAG TPA: undecaprenyl-diphosphate phosphatase [Bacillota bacterium]|nr:undecaprenyl-diphosphate phosphatase [Bacillota bacterium]HPF42279.1 undecaprenyl-diphosphate phosphatase [Bacillota bacterium]HPJ86113.1 undecaprenyl-diphosphate phosphatase [Bacillota bacterium]HPQ61954.1 undecaprenyl-diphosphate phosphatase [Bacillota bacterium]